MAPSDQRRIDRLIDIARGAVTAGPRDREKREASRIPYSGRIAFIRLTPTGEKAAPTLLGADNISCGGLCAYGPRELSVGSRGAVMIEKSDGEKVVLGVRVVYANSMGPTGFECGFEFELQPPVVALEDFRDERGDLPLLGGAKAA